MDGNAMEYFLAVLVVIGFGYFLYTKIKASREARANRPPSSGGGGSGGDSGKVHHK